MRKVFAIVVMFFALNGSAEAFVAESMFFNLFQQVLNQAMSEAAQPASPAAMSAAVTADATAEPDVGQIEPLNRLWAKFVPKIDLAMDEADMLVYDASGKKTTSLKQGQTYYLTSSQEYANFVPMNGDELTFLALPGTRVKRVENGGATIAPLIPWTKPKDTAELKYTVHFGSAQNQPAGRKITGEFTGWVEPQKVAVAPAPVAVAPVEVPAPKGKNADLWAQLRAEVAGQPAPKPAPVVAEPTPVVVQPAPVAPAPVMVEPVAKPRPQPVAAATASTRINELWDRVVFAVDTPVSGGSWVFTTSGEQLFPGSIAKAGATYYLVANPANYTNYVPKSWRDFANLQLPGAKLEREGEFGARFVRPVGPWTKPRDTAKTQYVVHYNSAENRPGGFTIEGMFTGWVLPK